MYFLSKIISIWNSTEKISRFVYCHNDFYDSIDANIFFNSFFLHAIYVCRYFGIFWVLRYNSKTLPTICSNCLSNWKELFYDSYLDDRVNRCKIGSRIEQFPFSTDFDSLSLFHIHIWGENGSFEHLGTLFWISSLTSHSYYYTEIKPLHIKRYFLKIEYIIKFLQIYFICWS